MGLENCFDENEQEEPLMFIDGNGEFMMLMNM